MLPDPPRSGQAGQYGPSVVPIAWFLLQFAAVRPLLRLPGAWGPIAVAVVWIASAIGLVLLLRHRERLPRRLLASPWPSLLLVAVVLVVGLVAYPIFDERRSTGGGSDADDAVLVVLDNLDAGVHDPYGTDTYLGNPPATGPGSIVWFAPFASRSTYPVGLVGAVAILLVVLRACTGSWVQSSIVAGLLSLSVPFWEGLAQGSDHLPFACSLACAAAFVGRARRTPIGVLVAAMAGIALGVLATTRAAFGHVPLLVAIALWPRDRRAAAALGGFGVVVVLALHGALIARVGWTEYTPVQQLLVKSDEDLSNIGRLVVLAGVLVAIALLAAQLRRWTGVRPAPVLLAGVGAPMVAIALAGLVTARDPSSWSAGSYFLDTAVIATLWVSERVAVDSPE